MLKSSDAIRPISTHFVKALGFLLCFSVAPAFAEITVKPFMVKIEKISSTRRVYLFDLTQGSKPKVGKIFLLRTPDGQTNVIALRAIKSYKGTALAGARVRSYGEDFPMQAGESYYGIEKLGDAARTGNAEPNLTPTEQKNELDEIEKGTNLIPEALTYDPELDAGNSPVQEIPDKDLSLGSVVAIREVPRYDPYIRSLGLAFSLIRAIGPTGGSNYYIGGGVRYHQVFDRYLFYNEKGLQDSLSGELAVYTYKVIGYEVIDTAPQDTITVLPVSLTVKYTVWFSEDVAAHAWLGFIKNFVLDARFASDQAVSNLSALLPAAGIGVTHRMGPHWYLRGDLGLDVISLGIELRW